MRLERLWMLGQEARCQPMGHGCPMLVQWAFTSMLLRDIAYAYAWVVSEALSLPRTVRHLSCDQSSWPHIHMGKAGNETGRPVAYSSLASPSCSRIFPIQWKNIRLWMKLLFWFCFDIGIHLWNHHQNQDNKRVPHPPNFLVPFVTSASHLSQPSPPSGNHASAFCHCRLICIFVVFHWEFYVIGCCVFLYSKYSWALFVKLVKILGNSLTLSGLAFKLVRQNQRLHQG